jgi:hypothetical protein
MGFLESFQSSFFGWTGWNICEVTVLATSSRVLGGREHFKRGRLRNFKRFEISKIGKSKNW